MKEDREKFKNTLKVIQGGMPPKRAMKNIVIKQFEELKTEFSKVKDYPYARLDLIKKSIIHYQIKYGAQLEKIEPEDIENLDNRYTEFGQFLRVVKEAQAMQENEKLGVQKEDSSSEIIQG